MSAMAAAARGRAGRRPGSGGSFPPHPVPQAEQFALDTPVPPPRVLPRHLLNEGAHPIRDLRPARRVRIGPFSVDKAAVPGQERARGHDPMQPQAIGQQPGQGGEYGTVSPVWPRIGDLTPQHRDLMARNQDLRVLSGVAARQQRQPAEHLDHEQVDETDQHERRA
jgi:hypothetical protein